MHENEIPIHKQIKFVALISLLNKIHAWKLGGRGGNFHFHAWKFQVHACIKKYEMFMHKMLMPQFFKYGTFRTGYQLLNKKEFKSIEI